MEGPAGRGEKREAEVRTRWGDGELQEVLFFFSSLGKQGRGRMGGSISQELRRGSAVVCVYARCRCPGLVALTATSVAWLHEQDPGLSPTFLGRSDASEGSTETQTTIRGFLGESQRMGVLSEK